VLYGFAAMPAAATTTRVFNLDNVIAVSLASPALLEAREAIEQARADAQSISSLPNPTLGVEVGMLPLTRRYSVDEPGGPPELAIGVSLPIDGLLFGKRRAAVASAQIALLIAEQEYRDQVRERTVGTTLAFFTYLEAKALWDLAIQATRDLVEFESAVHRAANEGGRPLIDWQRVQLELRVARREERAAQLRTMASKAELSTWLGLSELNAWEIEGVLATTGMKAPYPVEKAYRMATQNRPDFRALEWRVEHATRDELVERRHAWPETSLGLGVARQFQRSIGAPDVTAWGATLEVGLPLFDRNQGNRRKAASAKVQAKHALAAAEVRLRVEVERTTQEWTLALENATEIAQTDLALATQVRDGMRKAHELGGRTLLEVLEAQRGYRETYQSFIVSRAECARAQANYEAVLGQKVTP
jgi:cobalt-zinc-cadmium efflux system outer membrane protein